MMMNAVGKILKLELPLKSIEPYFSDPDFTDASTNWSTHFLSSGNVVYSPSKSENEIMGVNGTHLLPATSYKEDTQSSKLA